LHILLLANSNMGVAREYDVWSRTRDHARRELSGLSRGLLRQITLNDLPVRRSVDDALRLVQAFQSTVGGFSSIHGVYVLTNHSADEG
jgi:peroxiredoxin (alkyl hydroperoxide reductase subunit C)